MKSILVLALLLSCLGCAIQRDPFNAETHYPCAYYQKLNREDNDWVKAGEESFDWDESKLDSLNKQKDEKE